HPGRDRRRRYPHRGRGPQPPHHRHAGLSRCRRGTVDPVAASADDEPLIAALQLSQHLGMLGPRPIAALVDQATAYVPALDAAETTGGVVVDLGSGGGVPGLVIARRRPSLRLVLVDRRTTRTDHLRLLVVRLGLTDRVEVRGVD